MKFYLTLATLFLLTNVNAQIPNGGFESWANDSLGYADPVSWTTTNTVFTTQNIFQDAGRVGGSSVQFKTGFNPVTNHQEGGSITLPELNCLCPIRPTILSGYWKTNNGSANDFLAIEVRCYDAANAYIGSGSSNTPIGGNLPNWTPFNFSISYTSSNAVATYTIDIIYFSASGSTTASANIDDLDFNVSVDAPSLSANTYSKVFNLGNGIFQIENSDVVSIDKVQVLDQSGRQLKNVMSLQNEKLAIDLSAYKSGIYFVMINGENGKVQIPLVVMK